MLIVVYIVLTADLRGPGWAEVRIWLVVLWVEESSYGVR
jgi:hypothetical protein